MSQAISPVVLCILDGWGLSDSTRHNAVALANTPTFDHLWTSGTFSTTRLEASGEHVGLPSGQIGNSEVGHLNLGAGRVVEQTLPRMNRAFADQTAAQLDAFQAFVGQAKAGGTGRVHLMGLASDGGVHSHSDHIVALDQMLTKAGLDVVLHLWSDGRDVPPNAAKEHWQDLLQRIEPHRVASVSGRYFSMDRDNRWDRVQQAYDAIIHGGSAHPSFSNPLDALGHRHDGAASDEFVVASVREGYQGFHEGDAIVCANFRSDRVREILNAVLQPDFDGFDRGPKPTVAAALAMTPYSDWLAEQMHVMFEPQDLAMGLGETVAKAGKTQFRLAETEKYPHVTFFFSGGREEPYSGEDRHVAPSPKVATYDLQPEMSSGEVGETLARIVAERNHDLIICNFANPDMVGHTGDLDAAMAACESVDRQLTRVVEAVEKAEGAMLVTADHGNCEQMWDPETNGPHTAHTTNPVPLVLVSGKRGTMLAPKGGALCDIAPTLLELAGIEQPAEMTGRSLLVG